MYYISIMINNDFQKLRGKIIIIYEFFEHIVIGLLVWIICDSEMKYKPLIYCQCQKISCETLRYLKYFIILFWKTCHVRYTLTLQRKIYVTRAWSWQFFPMMLYFLSYCSSQNCTQGQVKRKKSLSTYKDSLLERKLDACNNWTIVKLYYVSHIDCKRTVFSSIWSE